MTRPPELIETNRFLLRPPVPDDANSIFRKYARDEEVTRYLIWRPHENLGASRTFVDRCAQCWMDESAFPWVGLRKQDSELAGMLELRIDLFRADFGYVIAREYWGNGYATEIAKSIVTWAMAQANLFRVWATCDVDNLASARVLEKAGLQREGILRRFIVHPNISDEPRDSLCYSKVK